MHVCVSVCGVGGGVRGVGGCVHGVGGCVCGVGGCVCEGTGTDVLLFCIAWFIHPHNVLFMLVCRTGQSSWRSKKKYRDSTGAGVVCSW